MGFLSSLFGGGSNVIITVVLALAAVLLLIVLGVWALKLIFNATGNVSRGRVRRLSVTEVTPVDQKRQLVLIRRDNVEHLVLIGGGHDLLVETGIEAEPVQHVRPLRRQPAVSHARPRHEPALADKHESALADKQEAQAAKPATEPLARPARFGSLRHSGLMRGNERREPALIPNPAQNVSEPGADSATSSTLPAASDARRKEKAQQKPLDDTSFEIELEPKSK